jgi:hypothetical protein
MGADKHERLRKNKLPPFVPLLIETIGTVAWRELSHGARSLYVALRRRYSPALHNNGHIYLSQRDAARELKSHHDQIGRWYRELQHYGFIVQESAGCLGLDGKGKAPHWRLTELGCRREPPTRDFTKWNGQRFKEHKPVPPKTESRAGKPARGVRENRHTSVREKRHTSDRKRAGKPAHTDETGVPENQHISRLPLSSGSISPADDLSDKLEIPVFLRRPLG